MAPFSVVFHLPGRTCWAQPLGPVPGTLYWVQAGPPRCFPEPGVWSQEPEARSWPLPSSWQMAGCLGICLPSRASSPHPPALTSLAAHRKVLITITCRAFLRQILTPIRAVLSLRLLQGCSHRHCVNQSAVPLNSCKTFYFEIFSTHVRDARIVQVGMPVHRPLNTGFKTFSSISLF